MVSSKFFRSRSFSSSALAKAAFSSSLFIELGYDALLFLVKLPRYLLAFSEKINALL